MIWPRVFENLQLIVPGKSCCGGPVGAAAVEFVLSEVEGTGGGAPAM